MHDLRLLVGPHGAWAEVFAQGTLARGVGAQIAFGIELRGARINADALAQRAGRFALHLAQFVEHAKIVPAKKFVDVVERARIGPQFTQRVLQNTLEEACRVMEINRSKHHVTRHDERLECNDAARIDADHGCAVAFEEA